MSIKQNHKYVALSRVHNNNGTHYLDIQLTDVAKYLGLVGYEPELSLSSFTFTDFWLIINRKLGETLLSFQQSPPHSSFGTFMFQGICLRN